MTDAAPRVLVIDDEPALLVLLTAMLKRIGCASLTAENGKEGLAILEKEPVDLLILDLMLPDINGFDVLEKLRENERFSNLPVLILSAMADPDTIRKGLNLGADGYLTKPYLAHTLTSRVRTLLSSGRSNPTVPSNQAT